VHFLRTRIFGALLTGVLVCDATLAASAMPRLRNEVGGTFGGTSFLPTGVFITPTAAQNSQFLRLATGLRPDGNADATDASATALSPDGKTLLVLTSGYNTNFNDEQNKPLTYAIPDPLTGAPTAVTTPNSEWVFVYDVTGGMPRKRQQLSIPNTYSGLVWAPDGSGFYVSGGIDDRILAFAKSASSAGPYGIKSPALILGHNTNDTQPTPAYDGGILKGTVAGSKFGTGAVAAQIATSRDGKTLAVANMENDSLSLVQTKAPYGVVDVPFTTPGSNIARGEFPFGIAVTSDRANAAQMVYVSSLRDNQVVVVDAKRKAIRRVITVGSGPSALLLSHDESRLYVADGNSDEISVIDTQRDALVGRIALGGAFKGQNPNGLALSPDGMTLYVTLGGSNALAVVDLRIGRLVGRIPTGWYPTGVAVSLDGRRLFVVNEKSIPGPNPTNPIDPQRNTSFGLNNPTGLNQYGWALEKAGLLVIPTPTQGGLAQLSRVVAANNNEAYPASGRNAVFRQKFGHRSHARRFDRVRATGARHAAEDSQDGGDDGRIDHVIYIVKENRTYDQVLGDLRNGANGDPRLTVFGKSVTPNHHALASQFVTLDNFYDPGESSGVGWKWSTGGETNDYVERSQAVLYGNGNFRGNTYDYEGPIRNINLALAQTGGSTPFTVRETGLVDPSGKSSILPGPRDPASYEGDGNTSPSALGGYLWDEALRRGLSVRNYGFYADLAYYGGAKPIIPISRTPFASNVPQESVAKIDLAQNSDPYYRGYDNAVPDVFRYEEWAREFDAYVQNDNLPNLEFVRIMHDHFGKFSTAVEGLNTPALQMADNDYALGKIVEKVSHSPYWKHTAIFVIEDDPQDGPDHIDMHRSIALVASPHVRREAVVHDDYTTVNVVRTIEDLLGLAPLGYYDANAASMASIFGDSASDEPYDAIVPGSLCAPPVAPDLVGADCSNRGSDARRRTVDPVRPGAPAPRTRPIRRVGAANVDLHDGAWWAAMTDGMNFDEADKVDPTRFNAVLWYGMTGTIAPQAAKL